MTTSPTSKASGAFGIFASGNQHPPSQAMTVAGLLPFAVAAAWKRSRRFVMHDD
jgi:hypothetical protein